MPSLFNKPTNRSELSLEIPKKLLCRAFVSLLLFASINIAAFAQVPEIASVPQNLPASAALNMRHASFQKWHDQLKAKTVAHKSKCTGVTENTQLDKWCREEQGRLEDEKAKYIDAVNKFNADVAVAGEDLRDAMAAPQKVKAPQNCDECYARWQNDIAASKNEKRLRKQGDLVNKANTEFEDCKKKFHCNDGHWHPPH
jgi:hypothetical protein